MSSDKPIRFTTAMEDGAAPRPFGRRSSYFGLHSCRFMTIVMIALFIGQAIADSDSELQVRTTAERGIVTIERMLLDDSRVSVSVNDPARNQLFGRYPSDFTMTTAGRNAKIGSVQPFSESQDVPRHIVLVLDNSDSMRQRNAVEPLLTGADEILSPSSAVGS